MIRIKEKETRRICDRRAFIACFTGEHSYSFCVSHPAQIRLSLPSARIAKNTTSAHIHMHTRISYQFIFLSTNPSCSTDFSRHLRLPSTIEPYRFVLSLSSSRSPLLAHCLSFYKHTLLCLAHSSYLCRLLASQSTTDCVINVTHVVIDFMCERKTSLSVFFFSIFFFSFFYSSLRMKRKRKKEIKHRKKMKEITMSV